MNTLSLALMAGNGCAGGKFINLTPNNQPQNHFPCILFCRKSISSTTPRAATTHSVELWVVRGLFQVPQSAAIQLFYFPSNASIIWLRCGYDKPACQAENKGTELKKNTSAWPYKWCKMRALSCHSIHDRRLGLNLVLHKSSTAPPWGY